MAAWSRAGQAKKNSHSRLVTKWNNVAKTSIPSSAHLWSSPSIVQFLEMLSDDDDGITCGLLHLLKSRNYASASSSLIATHDYNNNDDNSSSSSILSIVGDSSGGGFNNNYDSPLPPMILNPFVMAPIVKMTATTMMTMTTPLPMPLLLLVPLVVAAMMSSLFYLQCHQWLL